jgi:hypothetical protein
MKLRLLGLLLAVIGLSWAGPTAFADPVGPGPWTSDSPTYSVQTCEGGQVNGMTFSLPGGDLAKDACSNAKQRAELRYENYSNDGQNYATGVRQFAGTFTINSMGGTRISLKQTFNGDAGPYFLLAVENTGRLYDVEGGATIDPSIAQVGTAVQVNTVHDTSAHKLDVYINGSLAYTDNNAPGGDFYDKIGAYQTSSGSGDINVTWSNVGFWHQ